MTVLALSRILNQVILAAWTIVVLVRMLLSSQAEVWQKCMMSLVGDRAVLNEGVCFDVTARKTERLIS